MPNASQPSPDSSVRPQSRLGDLGPIAQTLDDKLEHLKASIRKAGPFDVRLPGEAGTPTFEQMIGEFHNGAPPDAIQKAVHGFRDKGFVLLGNVPDDVGRIAIGIRAARDAQGREMVSASGTCFIIQNDVDPALRKVKLAREQVMFLLLKDDVFTQAISLTSNAELRQKFLGQITRDTLAFKTYVDMVGFAVQLGASDIHFEAFKGGKYRARFRVDGSLQDWGLAIDGEHAKRLVSLIKTEAVLDITETRRGQDGGITFGPKVLAVNPNLARYSLRVSIMPTKRGEKVNLRLLNSSSSGERFDLKKLGYPEDIHRQILKQVASPQGLILVTGPTGSGKTTTLYSILTHLNTPDVNIVTIEDPVEMTLDGINQGQVNTEIGNTFEQALRRYLRQDPDIIFVGEIRDKETAQVALAAANTGHLVLSTVHTNDSVATITRLLDLGVLKSQVADSLRAVLSQRLVRNLCGDCSEVYDAKDDLNELFTENLLSEPVPMRRKGSEEACAGCTTCHGTGFKGRTVVPELWIPGRKEKSLITSGVSAHHELLEAAEVGGMKALVVSAIEIAMSGKTSLRELSENVFTPIEIYEQRARIAEHVRKLARRQMH
ncbi:MAG: type II/IV secretion system protein [Deltaproteobacteria bacterium]|nr:type II/IV secretion system protein [Deltaproteobacteria bacterium]